MRLHGRNSYVVILIPETAINWTWEKQLAWLVGSAILGKAQEAQSSPQRAHYHEDWWWYQPQCLECLFDQMAFVM